MKDFSNLPDDLQAIARESDTLRRMMPRIIGVEGVKFVQGNFDNEGFRGAALQVWDKRKHETSRSSGKKVLSDRRHLRDGVRYEAHGLEVTIGVDGEKLPYAKLHNEGGTMVPTKKQRGYFWYMYKMAKKIVDADSNRKICDEYDLKEKNKNRAATGKKALIGRKVGTSKKVSAATEEMEFWKRMAMAKKLTFPKRKFLGESPVFWQAVKTEVHDRLDNIFKKYNLL